MPFTREARIYNLFHKNKDYAAEALKIKQNYPDVKTILEIGAGTGLLTKELLKLGFKMTVVEPSIDMLRTWRHDNVFVLNVGIEILPKFTFEKDKFDLTIAHYDVLNYIKPVHYNDVVEKLMYWSKQFSTEMWNLGSVKLFTHKKEKGWHRFRVAFKIGKTVHIWFIYTGKKFLVEKHTLYLHP